MIFIVNLDSAGSVVSDVTYGGVDVPAVSGGVASDPTGEVGRASAWYLDDPPTGTQTVVINRTSTGEQLWAGAITVTAAAGKKTEVYTPGIVLLENDGTVAIQSVTDGSPGTNSMRFAGGMFGHQTIPGAGTGSVVLGNIDIGAQGGSIARESTAGQGARNVGFNSGTSDDRAIVHLAVREFGNRPTNDPGTTRDLRIKGQLTDSTTVDFRISGNIPSSDTRDFRITGVAGGTSSNTTVDFRINGSGIFPTTGILDNFNRTDGDAGANWTTAFSNNGKPVIESNQLKNPTGNANNSGAYWNPSTFTDCEIYVTLPVLPSPSSEEFFLNARAMAINRTDPPPTNSS